MANPRVLHFYLVFKYCDDNVLRLKHVADHKLKASTAVGGNIKTLLLYPLKHIRMASIKLYYMQNKLFRKFRTNHAVHSSLIMLTISANQYCQSMNLNFHHYSVVACLNTKQDA